MTRTVRAVRCEITMHVLPERGTWRGFTEAELDRLGVTEATMRSFMQLILMYLCLPEPTTFYPPQEAHADHD